MKFRAIVSPEKNTTIYDFQGGVCSAQTIGHSSALGSARRIQPGWLGVFQSFGLHQILSLYLLGWPKGRRQRHSTARSGDAARDRHDAVTVFLLAIDCLELLQEEWCISLAVFYLVPILFFLWWGLLSIGRKYHCLSFLGVYFLPILFWRWSSILALQISTVIRCKVIWAVQTCAFQEQGGSESYGNVLDPRWTHHGLWLRL